MEKSLDSLNELLAVAASNLDTAANMVRDLDFSSASNIKKIGDALASIFEIQHDIYRVRPDLQPEFLKKK